MQKFTRFVFQDVTQLDHMSCDVNNIKDKVLDQELGENIVTVLEFE